MDVFAQSEILKEQTVAGALTLDRYCLSAHRLVATTRKSTPEDLLSVMCRLGLERWLSV